MGAVETEQEIIQRILNGNIEVFRGIVAKYKNLVFHVVRTMLKETNDHDDVAQEIFVRTYEHLPRFQFRSGLATWISRIAYNSCLNHLRRKKSRPQESSEYCTEYDRLDTNDPTPALGYNPIQTPTPLQLICSRETAKMVRDSISRLPLQQQVIVTLYYLEGFNITELAEAIDMPPGTIKSHLFRARAALKENLLEKFKIEDFFD